MFPMKNIICIPVKLILLQGSRWECPRYSEVRSLFEHVKKKDGQHLYDNFNCKMFMDQGNIASNSYWGQFCFPWC